jgi:hypothetical protein
VYERFRQWVKDGTWAAMKQHVMALAEADGDIDWYAQADSTVARVHQRAAGARKGGLTPAQSPGEGLPRRFRSSARGRVAGGPARGRTGVCGAGRLAIEPHGHDTQSIVVMPEPIAT